MSAEYPTCPHPRETWVREPAVYSSRCPECKNRPCYDCGRYGDKGSMIPLVSWMTGTCDDCYTEQGRRSKIREHYYSDRASREDRQRVWQAGRDADADATNPYDAPSHWEQSLIEQNEWLRAEVSA
jgi:hypothetical protein